MRELSEQPSTTHAPPPEDGPKLLPFSRVYRPPFTLSRKVLWRTGLSRVWDAVH